MTDAIQELGSPFYRSAMMFSSPDEAKASLSYNAFKACGYEVVIIPYEQIGTNCVVVAFQGNQFMGFGTV